VADNTAWSSFSSDFLGMLLKSSRKGVKLKDAPVLITIGICILNKTLKKGDCQQGKNEKQLPTTKTNPEKYQKSKQSTKNNTNREPPTEKGLNQPISMENVETCNLVQPKDGCFCNELSFVTR
jgi:hypothetical protein